MLRAAVPARGADGARAGDGAVTDRRRCFAWAAGFGPEREAEQVARWAARVARCGLPGALPRRGLFLPLGTLVGSATAIGVRSPGHPFDQAESAASYDPPQAPGGREVSAMTAVAISGLADSRSRAIAESPATVLGLVPITPTVSGPRTSELVTN